MQFNHTKKLGSKKDAELHSKRVFSFFSGSQMRPTRCQIQLADPSICLAVTVHYRELQGSRQLLGVGQVQPLTCYLFGCC